MFVENQVVCCLIAKLRPQLLVLILSHCEYLFAIITNNKKSTHHKKMLYYTLSKWIIMHILNFYIANI